MDDDITRCPDCRGPAVMVEISEIYDGGLFFECPTGGRRWHRWPEDHRLHDRAVPFVSERPTCTVTAEA